MSGDNRNQGAKSQASEAPVASVAKAAPAASQDAQAPKADHGRLEETALHLYGDLTKAKSGGFNAEAIALEAFRRADAFLSVSAKVAAGELSTVAEVERPREIVEVHEQVQRPDEKWEPKIDPQTDKPVVTKMPADPFAYAPNLPVDHPINQRFRPYDESGLTPQAKKIVAANKAREAAAANN